MPQTLSRGAKLFRFILLLMLPLLINRAVLVYLQRASLGFVDPLRQVLVGLANDFAVAGLALTLVLLLTLLAPLCLRLRQLPGPSHKPQGRGLSHARDDLRRRLWADFCQYDLCDLHWG